MFSVKPKDLTNVESVKFSPATSPSGELMSVEASAVPDPEEKALDELAATTVEWAPKASLADIGVPVPGEPLYGILVEFITPPAGGRKRIVIGNSYEREFDVADSPFRVNEREWRILQPRGIFRTVQTSKE